MQTDRFYRSDPNKIPPGPYYCFTHEYCPPPNEGYSYLDIDQIQRRFNPRDPWHEGIFRIAEIKSNGARISHSEKVTYGMLDRIMKKGADKDQYYGAYLIETDRYYWAESNTFKVNDRYLSKQQFIQWLSWNLDIEPYIF